MVKSYETIQPVPFGGYQLVERLAMGGMAEVYLARPNDQQRFVALKRILPNIAADEEFIAMFIDEAKIAGSLDHPNIIRILDLGKINNSYFMAMDYVSGHDLRALWDRTRDADGGKPAMSIGLACYVVKKICDGLDYAHRRRDPKGRPLGIIHRDVSPQNVLVAYDGELKIIDFGIAKAAQRLSKTQTGILKGKFAYMAPEQARGEPTDHRADIFAIGVILYELLTGERAFKADSDFALLEKVRRVDMPSPRSLRTEIPKDLERIIYKALAKEAGDRYAWASALGADLDRFMSDQGFASSKEELGAFLQRTFKEEYKEEQKRLASYRALFVDDEAASSSAVLRGNRPISLGSGDKSGDRSDERERSGSRSMADMGTAVGDSVDDSGANAATAFEEGRTAASHDSMSAGSAQILEMRNQARRIGAAGAPSPNAATQSIARPALASLPGPADDPDDIDDDEIDASEEASALGAAIPSHTSRSLPGRTRSDDDAAPESSAEVAPSPNGRPGVDETQIDPDATLDADDRAPKKPPTSGIVARDEVPRKLRVVAGPPSPPHSSPSNPSTPRPPPVPPAGATSSEPSRSGSAPRPAERSQQRFVDETERSERSPGRPPGTASSSGGRTSVGMMVAAAFLGAIIGAGIVGIAWLASSSTAVQVVFVATPRQAEVRLGSTVLCTQTPCAAALEPGKHELLFRAPGAEELSRTVEVKAEGTPPVEVVLERLRDDVRLETSPPGANVSIDDKPLEGTTPLTLPRLVVGRNVRIKLTRDGFEPLEVNRVVDDEAVWRFDLPTSTTIWTLTPDPADALMDGPGRERDGKMVTTVTKKNATMRFTRPGCADKQMVLYPTGRPEAEQKVVLECKKLDSGLYIQAPRRTSVKIDGIDVPRYASLSPYPLPAGTWTVTLRSARGKTESHTVELRAGETLTLPSRLK